MGPQGQPVNVNAATREQCSHGQPAPVLLATMSIYTAAMAAGARTQKASCAGPGQGGSPGSPSFLSQAGPQVPASRR